MIHCPILPTRSPGGGWGEDPVPAPVPVPDYPNPFVNPLGNPFRKTLPKSRGKAFPSTSLATERLRRFGGPARPAGRHMGEERGAGLRLQVAVGQLGDVVPP